MFSCEVHEIFSNIFFTEHLRKDCFWNNICQILNKKEAVNFVEEVLT